MSGFKDGGQVIIPVPLEFTGLTHSSGKHASSTAMLNALRESLVLIVTFPQS